MHAHGPEELMSVRARAAHNKWGSACETGQCDGEARHYAMLHVSDSPLRYVKFIDQANSSQGQVVNDEHDDSKEHLRGQVHGAPGGMHSMHSMRPGFCMPVCQEELCPAQWYVGEGTA